MSAIAVGISVLFVTGALTGLSGARFATGDVRTFDFQRSNLEDIALPSSITSTPSGSTLPGLTSKVIPVAFDPIGLAFDSSNNEVFVLGSDNVSVISESASSVVATIPLPPHYPGPDAIVMDAANGDLYLVSSYFPTEIISARTDSLIGSIEQVGAFPGALAVNPATGTVYIGSHVGINGPDNISVIDGSTNSVIATLRAGAGAQAATLDPLTDQLYVANIISANVSVFDASRNSLEATIPVQGYPDSLAVDSLMGEVFIASSNPSHVYVVNETSNTVVAAIHAAPAPAEIAIDPTDYLIFVMCQGAGPSFPGNVTVVSESSNTIVATVPVGALPTNIAYDAPLGDVVVTNSESNNLTIIDAAGQRSIASIPVQVDPTALVVDESTGTIFVANSASDSVSMIVIAHSSNPALSWWLWVLLGVLVSAAVVMMVQLRREPPKAFRETGQ